MTKEGINQLRREERFSTLAIGAACFSLFLKIALVVAALCGAFQAKAELTQQDVDHIRHLIRMLAEASKEAKETAGSEEAKRYARGIENIAYAARTLGVGLDELIDDDPADPVAPPTDPVDTPAGAATLVPGTGFDGPTPQPAAVGSRTEKTMARWDVVPEQRFTGIFQVGVVAFHSYGIDRVEMSFNGGPWKSIDKPTLNPRTSVIEYWAAIDAADIDDGLVELRAIAYPKDGTPRVLEPLVLFANAGGSVKFPILELGAGTHRAPAFDPPEEGWYIIRAKPGVAKQDVILQGGIGKDYQAGNIKVQGVTIKVGAGNRGPGKYGRLWLDDVDFIGVDAEATGGELTWWISDHKWKAKYHTNMNISRVQVAFHACNEGIIRNVKLDSIYEDVFRQAGLIANVEIEDLTSGRKSYHPDVFQWYNQNPTNMIVYGVTAQRVAGQGLFPGDLTDSAFVDVDLNVVGQYRPLQMQGKTTNVLIQDSDLLGELDGTLRYDKGFEPDGLVFRRTRVGVEPYEPLGAGRPGVVHAE